MDLPSYDRNKSYRWNYDHPPQPVEIDVPEVGGSWQFAGLSVDSPMGISAGPLLNGRWCLYYASLGFDVLTYKTVRTSARDCYPLPNLLPVDCGSLRGSETHVVSSRSMQGSWAVSFGMPSVSPDLWRRDIEWTRNRLPAGKILNVSVVGTVQEGWSLEQLAEDYAQCAAWAVESGADCIETNLSCPNVSTCDGQLYQQPAQAGWVARTVRDAIGTVGYIVKIGHLPSSAAATALLDAVAPSVDGVALTNSVATKIVMAGNGFAFDGQRRGICGTAIRDASLKQVKMFSEFIKGRGSGIALIGGGGVATAGHVEQFLANGASAVHVASAAMIDPLVGIEMKRQLRSDESFQARFSNRTI